MSERHPGCGDCEYLQSRLFGLQLESNRTLCESELCEYAGDISVGCPGLVYLNDQISSELSSDTTAPLETICGLQSENEFIGQPGQSR